MILIDDLKKMALKADDHAAADEAMWRRLLSVRDTPGTKYFYVTQSPE